MITLKAVRKEVLSLLNLTAVSWYSECLLNYTAKLQQHLQLVQL